MPAHPFALLLAGGDRRSIGAANEVARAVLARPDRVPELWSCLSDPDQIVRMRAADALQKVAEENPSLVAPYKAALLDGRMEDGTAEMRWNLLAILPLLPLSPAEAGQAVTRCAALFAEDRSRIVRVVALQAAHDIAHLHPAFHPVFAAMRDAAINSPIPSIAARARKLL